MKKHDNEKCCCYEEYGFTPVDLLCEYAKNPLGIDTCSPRFSWRADHMERGMDRFSCVWSSFTYLSRLHSKL